MPKMNEEFSQIRRRWLVPPLGRGETFSAAVRDYLELQRTLRTDHSLKGLSEELYPELLSDREKRPSDPATAIYVINQMLQLMESTWLSVRGDRVEAQLLSRGWLNAFRRWTSSPMFRHHWLRLRGEYSPDFVRFCERELNLSLGFPFAQLLKMPESEKSAGNYPSPLTSIASEFRMEWRQEDFERWITRARADQLYICEGTQVPAIWWIRLSDLPLIEKLSVSSLNEKQFEPPPNATIINCGLILAYTSDDCQPNRVDLLVWIRPAYRNLGIGRKSVGSVIESLWRHMVVRLRESDCSSKEELTFRAFNQIDRRADDFGNIRLEIWKNFFYYYGFRSQTASKELASGAIEIELERRFKEMERRTRARWWPRPK
jgi:hypothetical protein